MSNDVEWIKRRISFIIPARNESKSRLDSTIDNLLHSAENYRKEIIIIDDASDEEIKHPSSHVRIITNKKSIGVSKSRRLGSELSNGDVLVWLDAHMSFDSGWLEQMLSHLNSETLLCSAAWNYDLTHCYCYGADLSWRHREDTQSKRNPGFAVKHRVHKPLNDVDEIPMTIGGCNMMLHDSFNRLGGFSPLSRVWGINEQELSIRAWLLGFKVQCVSNAKVGHFYRSSFPYPVQFNELEFNQYVLVKTLFEEQTISHLDNLLKPFSSKVEQWIDEDKSKINKWRNEVQSRRKISDKKFFQLHAKDIPIADLYN